MTLTKLGFTTMSDKWHSIDHQTLLDYGRNFQILSGNLLAKVWSKFSIAQWMKCTFFVAGHIFLLCQIRIDILFALTFSLAQLCQNANFLLIWKNYKLSIKHWLLHNGWNFQFFSKIIKQWGISDCLICHQNIVFYCHIESYFTYLEWKRLHYYWKKK